MHRRSAALVAATLTFGGLAATGGAAAQASAPTAAQAATADVATGTYYPITANQRILDTRSGVGTAQGVVTAGAQGERVLKVAGRAGVPATGVSAVVLNLTGVSPTHTTFVTAYPSGASRPPVSSLNLRPAVNRANLVTVPVGADGNVRLYNSTGTVHLLADVMGFYAGSDIQGTHGIGSQYFPVDPERMFDSRYDGGALAPREGVLLGFDYGPEDNPNIKGYAVNITAITPTTGGYLVAWDGTGDVPPSSSVNFVKGQTVPNMAVVPAAPDPDFGFPSFVVANGPSATVDVAVDVVGVYVANQAEGLRFEPMTPKRIIDTRTGVGGYRGTIGPTTKTRTFTAPAEVAGADTVVLVANTTAIAPTAATFLKVWENGTPQPPVSNLNAAKGENVANATFVNLSALNRFDVYNNSGAVNLAMDVAGRFEYYLVPTAGTASARQLAAADGLRDLAPLEVIARRR